jgi:hypothetical protein
VARVQVSICSPDGGGSMKNILVHLADDQPLDTSVARLSLIGRTSGRGTGRRQEGLITVDVH